MGLKDDMDVLENRKISFRIWDFFWLRTCKHFMSAGPSFTVQTCAHLPAGPPPVEDWFLLFLGQLVSTRRARPTAFRGAPCSPRGLPCGEGSTTHSRCPPVRPSHLLAPQGPYLATGPYPSSCYTRFRDDRPKGSRLRRKHGVRHTGHTGQQIKKNKKKNCICDEYVFNLFV